MRILDQVWLQSGKHDPVTKLYPSYLPERFLLCELQNLRSWLKYPGPQSWNLGVAAKVRREAKSGNRGERLHIEP